MINDWPKVLSYIFAYVFLGIVVAETSRRVQTDAEYPVTPQEHFWTTVLWPLLLSLAIIIGSFKGITKLYVYIFFGKSYLNPNESKGHSNHRTL